MLRIHRPLLALLAVVAALVFTVATVDARVSGSSGSRGGRTFSAPAATNTAPRAAPIERTMTQAPRPGSAVGQAAGQTARPGLLGGGMFGGGLLGGLAAGFIGAGLFGMLFGHGFMGGMGGFASILGLLLQVGLVVIVARLAWAWWQRRNQPAMAGGPSLRDSLSGGQPACRRLRRVRRWRIGGSGRRADRGDARGLRRVREAAWATSRPPTARKTSARSARI